MQLTQVEAAFRALNYPSEHNLRNLRDGEIELRRTRKLPAELVQQLGR